MKATHMSTSVIENLGGGKFQLHILPIEAQVSPTYGITTRDIDGDGYLDLLLSGNDYGIELGQGRADAMKGVTILNNKMKWKTMPIDRSGWLIPGDGKGIASIWVDGKPLHIAAQNRDSLVCFTISIHNGNGTSPRFVSLPSQAAYGIEELTNGAKRKREYYWGSTFGAQDSRKIEPTPDLRNITIFDTKGNVIELPK
jgi:enediyne biosynthesis protein E4